MAKGAPSNDRWYLVVYILKGRKKRERIYTEKEKKGWKEGILPVRKGILVFTKINKKIFHQGIVFFKTIKYHT